MSNRPWEDASGLYTGTYDTTDTAGSVASDQTTVNPVWSPDVEAMHPERVAYLDGGPEAAPMAATTATDVLADPMSVTNQKVGA